MNIKLFTGILVAFLCGFSISIFINKDSFIITYLQKFEIENYPSEFVRVKGAYLDSDNDVNLINLECSLTTDTCIESTTFITKDGIVGVVQLKEYKIIEKSETRIIAEYKGLASFHTFTIDLATNKVLFKTQDNNSADFNLYELVDGENLLKMY